MIIRCTELYHGRWCPCCGACQCRDGHAWALAGANPACPLHGEGVPHGHVKVVTGKRERRSDRIRRMGVQERLRRPRV